jgi:hypothetical protein
LGTNLREDADGGLLKALLEAWRAKGGPAHRSENRISLVSNCHAGSLKRDVSKRGCAHYRGGSSRMPSVSLAVSLASPRSCQTIEKSVLLGRFLCFIFPRFDLLTQGTLGAECQGE